MGTKKNSKGYKEIWVSYKLHTDVNDCGLPVSVAMTSASVHDSQVAILLIKMTSARVDYPYDVMDAAYDAASIYQETMGNGSALRTSPTSQQHSFPPGGAFHARPRKDQRTAY